jgi:hypothetical protein
MKNVAILAFCLTSAWTLVSRAQDAAPPADAAPQDAGGCILSAMNNTYDDSCTQCRSDAVAGSFETCKARSESQGKGRVCSRDENGVTIEIWCSPAAVSTAKPSGCGVQAAGGPFPFGALATIGGLGLAIVLGRHRRRR